MIHLQVVGLDLWKQLGLVHELHVPLEVARLHDVERKVRIKASDVDVFVQKQRLLQTNFLLYEIRFVICIPLLIVLEGGVDPFVMPSE